MPRKIKSADKREKRIVDRGNEREIGHREDFRSCPYCDERYECEIWDRRAHTLVLEPAFYKAGAVAIISDCQKCGKDSWVHTRINGFQFGEIFPADWGLAVEAREKGIKLHALREWGAGLCWNCKHLKDGKVEWHAWRGCIRGSGPALTECEKFEPLSSGQKPSA